MNADDRQRILDALHTGRRTATGWLRLDCPGFCERVKASPDTKKSFALFEKTGGFVCNRCGTTGYLSGYIALPNNRPLVSKPKTYKSEQFWPMWHAD